MNYFISFAKKLITELRVMKKDYDRAKYPGLKVIGRRYQELMSDIVQIQSPVEFFQTVSKKQDDLLDFAEDYEPIKLFSQESRKHFDKSLLYLEKYDDSKNYIVDAELESVVDEKLGRL